MRPIQLFTAVSLVASLATAHIGGGHLSLQEISPQMYCGRVLARALALLCFEEEDLDKRSEGTMYNSIFKPYYKDQEPQYHQWVSPNEARGLGFPSRGKRQGIVNECCQKPCSLEELQSYC